MTTAPEGKEVEIERLLGEGSTPVELIRRGFKRGTVYKVNRRLGTNVLDGGGLTPDKSDVRRDGRVEDDPEVVELKMALRRAELQRQIEEISGPSSTERRLGWLEEAVEILQATFVEAHEDRKSLEGRLRNTPLYDLRERFECDCGSSGFFQVEVTCTNCYSPKRYGWRPKGP